MGTDELPLPHTQAVDLARQYPGDVGRQIDAAYACDRFGDEQQAAVYYEKAWALGVPTEHRHGFLLGFSSTLRNVGRADESLQRLQLANAEFPDNAVLLAFTALTLHTLGQANLALATMLDAALNAREGNDLAQYQRALREYRDELAGEPIASP